MRSLSKRFGGALALDNVALTVLPGEVHGLLGENGSGKSTLIKVLAGFHDPEPGAELEVGGQRVSLPLTPGAFRDLGISFVHQDLALIPSLTVLENLRIGDFAIHGWRHISWRSERRLARATFADYGVSLDPDATVASLRPVERALLAVVRAACEIRETVRERESAGGHGAGGLLVLDEPTVFLPKADTEHLFELVREVVTSGASVLFVSHDLDEVLEVTDRVTVLRDGRVHGTVVTAEVDPPTLVRMIIGRELESVSHSSRGQVNGAPLATVSDMSGDRIRPMSFEVRPGEVLGLTGLVGSGFEEIPYLMFGARPCTDGVLTIHGDEKDMTALTPLRAIEAGMALIPGDRQRDGSIPSLSVAENVTMQILDRYYHGLRLQRSEIIGRSRELMDVFDVRPSDPHLPYSSLSGGNQQKALLAKWLETEPQLLLLHEPTQGVDIGAREQIFKLIRSIVETGTAVVCASSDYEQLARICDRVLVVTRGDLSHTLSGDELTKERITERCYAAP